MPTETDVWGSLLAGPYGFVVVIFALLWLGLKEWRKGREVELERQKTRADRAEAERDAAERARTEDRKALQTEILALRNQVFELQKKLADAGLIDREER